MKLNNPFTPKPLNDIAPIRCPFGHLHDNPHPTIRYADHIGYFTLDEASGEFLYNPRPFGDNHAAASQAEGKLKRSNYSFVFCILCMSQASADSIPGVHVEAIRNNRHVGVGAHIYQYASPETLRHLKTYSGRVPTQPNSGRWIMANHPSEIVDDKHPTR